MKLVSFWRNLILGCLFLFSSSSLSGNVAAQPFAALPNASGDASPLETIQRKYESLSPKNKFIAAACVGFVGSRLAIHAAVRSVKVAGAAFIVAEVLQFSGVMDQLPALSEEHYDLVNQVKFKVLQATEDFRVQVRRRLNPQTVGEWFEKEKFGAYGVASGAFVGALL